MAYPLLSIRIIELVEGFCASGDPIVSVDTARGTTSCHSSFLRQHKNTCLSDFCYLSAIRFRGYCIAPVLPGPSLCRGLDISLNGAHSSDEDGSIDSYPWSQTLGASVGLSDSASSSPWFTAPFVNAGGASLTFQLTVTDEGGLQSTDTCVADVSWTDNAPPAPPGGFQVSCIE